MAPAGQLQNSSHWWKRGGIVVALHCCRRQLNRPRIVALRKGGLQNQRGNVIFARRRIVPGVAVHPAHKQVAALGEVERPVADHKVVRVVLLSVGWIVGIGSG